MKWIKAVRVIVALALLSLGTMQLVASGTQQYERYYYTDATYSEECGQALVFCDGATYSGCYWSPYYLTYELPSCTTPGDNPGGGGGPLSYPEGSNCKDGFDNDHDGLTDLDDPDCW
jgi:hypothetical protein